MPSLVVFWAEGEPAGDDNGICERQMGIEGEVGGRGYLRSALLEDQPFRLSISRSSKKALQGHEISCFARPNFSYTLQGLPQ